MLLDLELIRPIRKALNTKSPLEWLGIRRISAF